MIKRVKEFGGDVSQFHMVRIQSSVLKHVAIAKTEPGHENDGTTSVCWIEFVELFRAVIKMLHPVLTVIEGTTRAPGASRYSLRRHHPAHSKESVWQSFRNNHEKETFLDRIYTVNVSYREAPPYAHRHEPNGTLTCLEHCPEVRWEGPACDLYRDLDGETSVVAMFESAAPLPLHTRAVDTAAATAEWDSLTERAKQLASQVLSPFVKGILEWPRAAQQRESTPQSGGDSEPPQARDR